MMVYVIVHSIDYHIIYYCMLLFEVLEIIVFFQLIMVIICKTNNNK